MPAPAPPALIESTLTLVNGTTDLSTGRGRVNGTVRSGVPRVKGSQVNLNEIDAELDRLRGQLSSLQAENKRSARQTKRMADSLDALQRRLLGSTPQQPGAGGAPPASPETQPGT